MHSLGWGDPSPRGLQETYVSTSGGHNGLQCECRYRQVRGLWRMRGRLPRGSLRNQGRQVRTRELRRVPGLRILCGSL